MNCLEISEHLSAYLDDELEPEFVGRVKEHLAECEICRGELDALRRLTETVRALPRESAPPGIETEVVGYIERDMLLRREEPVRAGAPWRRALGVVALAAASLVIAVGAYRIFTHEETTTTPPGEFSVAKGETPRQTDDLGTVAENGRKSTTDHVLKPDGNGDRSGDATGHALDSTPTPRPEPEPAMKKGTGGTTDVAFESKFPGTKTEPAAPITLAARDKEDAVDKKADGYPGVKVAGTLAPSAELARGDANEAGARKVDAAKPAAAEPTTPPAPPAPEFLDLVVTAQNVEAARTRLVACAAELDIHTVDRDRIYGLVLRDTTLHAAAGDATEGRTGRSGEKVESNVGGGGARGVGTPPAREPLPTDDEKTRAMRREGTTPAKPVETAEQPTTRPEPTAEPPRAEAGRTVRTDLELKDQKKLKEAEVTPDFAGPEMRHGYAEALRGPAPAVVFAVPREKFPQFVARLAAEGIRVQIAPRADIARLQGRDSDGRTATAPGEVAPLAPAKTGVDSPADVKTLEDTRAGELRKRVTAAKTDLDAVKTPVVLDDGKDRAKEEQLDRDEQGGKGVQAAADVQALRVLAVDPNMVYVQVYFTRAPAPVPVPAPVPADKTDAEKKAVPADKTDAEKKTAPADK